MRTMIAGIILAMAITTPTRTFNNRYVDIFLVSHLDNEIVTFISDDGNEFEWYIEKWESWEDDDVVVSIMNSNGTDTREDDSIEKLVVLM